MKKVVVLLLSLAVVLSVMLPVAAAGQDGAVLGGNAVKAAEKLHLRETLKPRLDELKELKDKAEGLRAEIKDLKVTISGLTKEEKAALKGYREEIHGIVDSQLSLSQKMLELRIKFRDAVEAKDADGAAAAVDSMIEVAGQKLDNLEKIKEIREEIKALAE